MNANKAKMMQRITAHGEKLLRLFPDATQREPVALCKALRKLEARASRITVALCNGATSQEAADSALEKVETVLKNLLFGAGPENVPIHINRDPRGYALKIDDQYMRTLGVVLHRDWGGYGILAPDFSNDNS